MPQFLSAGLAMLAAAAVLAGPAIPAGSYSLDPQTASLVAKTSHLGGLYRSTVRFRNLSGGANYDPATRQIARVVITVDPNAVDAASPALAEAVVRAFEPEKYPEIRFASTALSMDGDGRGRLDGNLTMHGRTRPISLEVAFKGDSGGQATTRLEFSGVGRVRRTDFGMTAGRPFASDVVELTFDVDFVRK